MKADGSTCRSVFPQGPTQGLGLGAVTTASKFREFLPGVYTPEGHDKVADETMLLQLGLLV